MERPGLLIHQDFPELLIAYVQLEIQFLHQHIREIYTEKLDRCGQEHHISEII